jgi:hypothetical protein
MDDASWLVLADADIAPLGAPDLMIIVSDLILLQKLVLD